MYKHTQAYLEKYLSSVVLVSQYYLRFIEKNGHYDLKNCTIDIFLLDSYLLVYSKMKTYRYEYR